jgi:hypothetical protein
MRHLQHARAYAHDGYAPLRRWVDHRPYQMRQHDHGCALLQKFEVNDDGFYNQVLKSYLSP